MNTLPPSLSQALLNEGTAQISQQAGGLITSHPLLGLLFNHWIITLIIGLFILIYIKSKITAIIEAIGDFLLLWTGRAAVLTIIVFLIKDVLLK